MGERVLQPLEGKRVVITRAAAQARKLVEALENAGASAILAPAIRIAPPEQYEALDAALSGLQEFDWILFTSRNAVKAVRDRAAELRIQISPDQSKVGVVGPATGEEAQDAGFRVTHTASRAIGKALVDDLAAELCGKRVFLPRSDRADPELRRALEACGAEVSEVIVYRTLLAEAPADSGRMEIISADAVVFFSPSAVTGFLEMFGDAARDSLTKSGVAVALGPVTHATLQNAGIERIILAEDAAVAGIVRALAHFFEQLERPASTGAKSA